MGVERYWPRLRENAALVVQGLASIAASWIPGRFRAG
jgi:hypothetical protein